MEPSIPRQPVVRLAVATIVVAAVLVGVSGYYAATELEPRTDTVDLLAKDLPFRQAMNRYREHFPQNEQQFVLVVEAATPEAAAAGAARLVDALRAEPDFFEHVHRPMGGDYFERQGLLFRGPGELREIADRLRRTRPLLEQLRANPTVEGLFSTLGTALTLSPDSAGRLSQLVARMTPVIEARRAGEPAGLSWQLLLGGNGVGASTSPPFREVLIAQPNVDYGKVVAAEEATRRARLVARRLGFGEPGEPTLRVTGRVALSASELKTVLGGMVVGVPIALALVAGVLYLGLRSSRLVITTIVGLLVGLVLTAGFATFAVGHLNLISMAFAMLYVGLGVDFAIHFNLRFRTQRRRGEPRLVALASTLRTTGRTLALCAATTAIGFFAFVPTSFAGVAELGIIAGGGMVISLLVTLTVLPALLALLDTRAPKAPVGVGVSSRLLSRIMHVPEHHRRPVIVAAVTFIVGGAFALPLVRFNTNPLDLRRDDSEAVQTLRDLRAEGGITHWSVTVLADGEAEARRLAEDLAELPEVARTVSVRDLVPTEQASKLAIIADLRRDLGDGEALTFAADRAASPDATAEAARTLIGAVNAYLDGRDRGETGDRLGEFRDALTDWLAVLDAASPEAKRELARGLHEGLLGSLPLAMNRLRTALSTEGVTLETMPEAVKRLWVSPAGVRRLMVMPTSPLQDDAQRERFVAAVQAVAPAATGAPVIEVAAGRTVVAAFQSASAYAIAGIIIVLLIQMRSIRLAASVLLPMLMAAMLTAVGMVFCQIPFNFANVIALPLLLGIGVDNGIHMVHRARGARTLGVALLETSTARGVLFSTLTTLVSFGSLAFSPHPGTASMGQVLSMGLILNLIATIVLVPALVKPSELTIPEENLPTARPRGED